MVSTADQVWKQLYERAILELGTTQLLERITEARTAMFDRAEEILTNPPGEEQRALRNALRTLRLLEEVVLQKKHAA